MMRLKLFSTKSLIAILCSFSGLSSPVVAAKRAIARVDMPSVALIGDNEAFNRNISQDKIAVFVEAMRRSITRSIPAATVPCTVVVRVTLYPQSRPKIEITSQDAPEAVVAAIYRGFEELPNLRTKIDELPFVRVEFAING
jgi:hypothetical protein